MTKPFATEFCSMCGRDRPVDVSAVACMKGGMCEWISPPRETPSHTWTYPTDNSLFVIGRFVAFQFEGISGYVIGRIASATDTDVQLIEAYYVNDLDPLNLKGRPLGRVVVNRARFTFAIDCPADAYDSAEAAVKAREEAKRAPKPPPF